MTAITYIIPYEMIEKILTFTNKTLLVTLFMSASKYNDKLAQHIRIVIIGMKTPIKRFMHIIKNRINKVVFMRDYLNIISTVHELKIIDFNEKQNLIYKQYLIQTIDNEKQKRKFENLMKSVGKYCESP